MAQRYEYFDVVASAGSTPSLYEVIAIDWPAGIVTGFRIKIPGGHRGLTGIQLAFGAGGQVIPRTAGAYFKGNRGVYDFETEDYPSGSGWFAQVFNRDVYDHTFHVGALIDELSTAVDALPGVLLLPRTSSTPYGELGPAPPELEPGTGGTPTQPGVPF